MGAYAVVDIVDDRLAGTHGSNFKCERLSWLQLDVLHLKVLTSE